MFHQSQCTRWFPIATSALAGQVQTFQHHVARSERNLTGMVDLLGCCGWQLLQTKEKNDICIQSLHNLWPEWYPGRSKHLHEWRLISLHRCPNNGLLIFPWWISTTLWSQQPPEIFQVHILGVLTPQENRSARVQKCKLRNMKPLCQMGVPKCHRCLQVVRSLVRKPRQ